MPLSRDRLRHLLLVAIREWCAWLSGEARHYETWVSVPWRLKRVAADLDAMVALSISHSPDDSVRQAMEPTILAIAELGKRFKGTPDMKALAELISNPPQEGAIDARLRKSAL